MSARDPDDWESHWSEHGESASKNPAREYRTRLILGTIADLGSPARVIDFGCGQGDLAVQVRGAYPGADIVGFDRSAIGVDVARRRVQGARFYEKDLLISGDSADSVRLRGWADLAICSELLEHVDEPETVLRNILPYLEINGRLVVTVPGGPMSHFDRHIGHRRHYDARDLRAMVERSGYGVERVFAAGFPFFNLYKAVVIARGEAVVRHAAAKDSDRSVSELLARSAYRVFRALFRLNLRGAPWGWQMVVVARRS